MAKDVITRFRLESTQFDSKLKQQAKALADIGKTATAAGKDFGKFTQDSVAAAKALGTMATSSTNAKQKTQELVGAFNDAAKAYNQLTKEQQQTDFGKAMAASLTLLQQRINEAKQELYNLGDAAEQVKSKSRGLFGDGGFTGMLQVAGGNLLASGVQKLGAEMADTIQQSIELARQGEGVRLAFERLNKPGLLDNLKESTHGTVSELELMKAAIKFDNFKLPLEDLGTYLAFAQQKAQDTGESVDNMVTSIVNGLGRQSVQILDNLGISAAEIRNRMKEGGDMTQVVAQIIREEMTKAGEYVETAATRAARAAADATNEMERLGREAQPFAEAWAGVWNEIKIGGMDFLTTVLGPIAESAQQIRNILNGEFKFKPDIPNLANGPVSPWGNNKQPKWGDVPVVKAPGGYVEVTDKNTGAVIGGKHFENLSDTNTIKEWQKNLMKTLKTGGSKTQTKPEQAQARFEQAQKDYQQALEQAAMELKAGTVTEADAKKKELQAKESLWKSIGDAREIYDSPKLREAQSKIEAEIVKFGGEVTSSIEAQKKAQEAARELERAQKKLAEAQTKLKEAKASGNLKERYVAEKAVTTAKEEVTRLTKGTKETTEIVNVEPGKVELPDVPKDVEQKVNVVPGNVELPDVPKEMDIPIALTSGNLDAFIGNLKERISQSEVGTEIYNNLTSQLADATALSTLIEFAVKNGIDSAEFDPQELWKKIFGDGISPGDFIKDEDWEKLTKKLKGKNGKKLTIDTNTGKEQDKKNDKSFVEVGSQMVGGINSMVGSLEQLGIEMPEGFKGVMDGISGMLGILQSIAVIVEAIEATEQIGTFLGLFHNGGVVHAANGFSGVVPGTKYSGDNIPALLDAGEVVLNRSQVNTLAQNLENGNYQQNLKLEAVVTGEQIRLALNNNGRRTGRGEYVQSNRM